MVWHGSSGIQTGRVILSEDQRLMLAKLAEDSEYWKTASDFVMSIDGRWLSSLTKRQLNWYYSIDAQLDVEVNRLEAKRAFGLEKEDE